MIKVLGLDTVIGMPQLFMKSINGKMVILSAKYVDDILTAALNHEWLEYTRDGCSQSFEVGSWKETPQELDVNGTEVTQDKESIIMTAKRLSKEVEVVQLTPARRKDVSSEISKTEQKMVRSMALQFRQ